mmetsp:Transcript_72238/g.165807  ORF Transcript_72238/g.165807 Transcript_72238/m.165807 type:complete len:613 (-) Transcript_72238:89-1927(-)
MRVVAFLPSVSAAALLQETVSSSSGTPVAKLRAHFAAVQSEIKKTGKVTPAVYSTVQKLLDMCTRIIEPAIVESHSSDQLLVLTVFREIISCDAHYKRFLAGEKSRAEAALKTIRTSWGHCGGSVEELKAKFSHCLDSRDVLVRHNNTVCCQEYAACSTDGYGDCETVKLEAGFAGCDYKAMTGHECFNHAKQLVAPLQGYFHRQDAKYEALRFECEKFSAAATAKIAECAYLQEAVNAKVEETNQISEEFNNAAAATESFAQKSCTSYRACREKTIAEYHQTVGPCQPTGAYGEGGDCVKNREVDRQNEWDSTKQISCMLRHYCEGGSFKEEQLKECKGSIDTYHLAVTYPQVPEEMPCELPDCGRCPGCDECVDRPYYQYETPCYATPMGEQPTCVEEPECPEWCSEPQVQVLSTIQIGAPPPTTTTQTPTGEQAARELSWGNWAAQAVGGLQSAWRSGPECPGSDALEHAGCQVTVTASATCHQVSEEIQARVSGQYSLWHDPHNNGTYTLDSVKASTLNLRRTTANGQYTDKQLFTLVPEGSTCQIQGCSQSQVFSVVDMSTNYCDLRMLYCGSAEGCKPVKHDFAISEDSVLPTLGAGKDASQCLRV